jgi:hypothetical protein
MKQFFVLIILILTACTKPSFQTALDSVDQGSLKKADRPSCEMDPTDLVIHPKIVSYDITSSKGGSFGFNLLTGFLKAFDLKFESKTGEIEVTTSLYSPMSYNLEISPDKNPALFIGDKREKATEGEFRAGIDISQFFVGLNYYWTTPFSKLTEKGLRASLAHSLEQFNSNPPRWKTVVADLANQYAILPVGLTAGLREGDEFAFYNVTYAWDGEPCTKLLMSVPTTKEPIAKGKVIRAEANASAVELTILVPEEKVGIGTQVEILNLVKTSSQDSRRLLRSVRIVDMAPTSIPVVNSMQVIDLSQYANIQFRSLLREFGLYPVR